MMNSLGGKLRFSGGEWSHSGFRFLSIESRVLVVSKD